MAMFQRKSLINGYVPSKDRLLRLNRDRIFNYACQLAKEDRQFRRDLLAVLKTMGKGERGGIVQAGEYQHILTAYKNALGIFGSRKAALEALVDGPFNKRSYESLEKLIRKLMK